MKLMKFPKLQAISTFKVASLVVSMLPHTFRCRKKHERVDQSCIQSNVTLLCHGFFFENPTNIAFMAHRGVAMYTLTVLHHISSAPSLCTRWHLPNSQMHQEFKMHLSTRMHLGNTLTSNFTLHYLAQVPYAKKQRLAISSGHIWFVLKVSGG